jgi:hypothetical protein
MNIDISANGIPSRSNLQHFVRCRADIALWALRDQTGAVSVHVDGAGELHDGDGTRCRVIVRSSLLPDVIVEHTDANLYVAVHKALDEAGWKSARGLVRQQNRLLQRQSELVAGRRPPANAGDFVEAGRAA